MNAVVLCGSGPSILKTPLREAGCPIAALSTAIRFVPQPDYWCLLDRLGPQYGPDWEKAANDPNIIKVVNRATHFEYPGVVVIHRDLNFEYLDPRPGAVAWKLNRTIFFACEYFMKIRDVKTVILAGVDLHVDPPTGDAHDGIKRDFAHKLHDFAMELDELSRFYEIAKAKGYRMLSWTPGSPINRFMEPWTPPPSSPS